ncbi:MAG: hypothetical protein GY826_40145, partial [Fuerstiella sp.]|nr:hypothetical protein [Fuerstiella sp.]
AAGVPAAGVPADFQQVEIEPKDSEAGATGRQDAADSQSDLAENRRVTGFVFGSGYDSDSGYETDSSYATRPEAGPESDAALALAELEDFERRTFGNTADVEANVDAPASLPVPEVEFSPLDELPVRPFDGRLNTGVVVDMDTPE